MSKNKRGCKKLIITAVFALAGASLSLTACSGWTPFGREYFNESGGKAESVYGKPWINSVTYGMVKDDTAHDLKDDFYLAVNYEWLKNTGLDDNKNSTGVYEESTGKVKSNVMSLLTDTGAGKDSDAVKNVYRLYMDWDGRNKEAFAEVKRRVDDILKITDIQSLTDYITSEDGVMKGAGLVSFDFDFDYNDPSKYCFVIVPTQLSLGDAAEYADRTDYGAGMYEAYERQAEYLLKKAGVDGDVKSIAEKGFGFEKEIAAYMKDQAFKFSDEYASSVNNPRTQEELSGAEGDFPLDKILEVYGISDSDHFFLLEPEWLEGMKNLYNADHVEGIKYYLLIKTLQKYAYISDEETFREMKKIYSEVNKTAETNDEEYAYQYVKSGLRESVNRLYAENFSDPDTKKDIESITDDIIDSYKKMIAKSGSLSEKTKEKALLKLDELNVNAVFADNWDDISDVEDVAKAKTLIEVSDALAEYKRQSMLSKMNAESERAWDFDITEADVSYWPAQNCINIGAGMAVGEFYDTDMPYEEKLGRIGMVIAPEIYNVIFGKGAMYDEKGKSDDWWQDADKTLIKEKSKLLVERLNTIKPFKNDTGYDGERIWYDMLAEMAGMDVLLELAQAYEGFDHDLFFKSYAGLYREIMTENYMELIGLNSSHPLSNIRVNETLSYSEKFLELYGISENDGMYKSKADRIVIW